MPGTPRRKKLVQPGLQLPLLFSFLGVGLLALFLQFLLIGARLTSLASNAGLTGGALADEVPGILLESLAFSIALLTPLLFLVGMTLTHRVVGPLGRIERYLRAVARGEESEPCRLRPSDKLHSLCEAVNLATEHQRGTAFESQADPSDATIRKAS